jgi:fatty-acid desaturase
MTEDNWHNNYYESPTFYKDGNKNVKPDMRRGYINFLENENIGHTPPT